MLSVNHAFLLLAAVASSASARSCRDQSHDHRVRRAADQPQAPAAADLQSVTSDQPPTETSCYFNGQTLSKGQQSEFGRLIYECQADTRGRLVVNGVGCKVDGVVHANQDKYKDGHFYSRCIVQAAEDGNSVAEELVSCIAPDGSEKQPGEKWTVNVGSAANNSAVALAFECRGNSTFLSYGPVCVTDKPTTQ